MWRRLGVLFTIVLFAIGVSTVAHGDDTTTTTTSDASSTSTSSTSTSTSTSTSSTSTSSTLPAWPAGVSPPFVPAVNAGRVQLEPLPTLPPTTVPATTAAPVSPGASTDIPANSGSGYRVIYAKRAQRVWQINADNTVARTYLVSGRMDQPNPGTYKVWSRSAYTCASHNSQTCMRFMVRFAHGPEGDNIGFHEIPKNNGRPLQSDSQLGTPLSHGCVRQATADAEAMWAFAAVGTTVVVVA